MTDCTNPSDELVTALGDLSQEQRETLAPEIDSLAADVQAVSDTQRLDELGASLDAILSGVQRIYDQTETLQCE